MSEHQRFGKWMIIGEAGRNRWGAQLVRVRCDCGTERNVLRNNLRQGASTSCGCKRLFVRHDTPQKRLLRELRERGAISTDEIVARGRNVQRAIEELRQRCLVSVQREQAKLTAKGLAHATGV